ncbi:hypothetical protein SCAR479_06228 [Seiridium cardinale]|uniref:Uncharacterized protein n=1 Tax=Seiridium cardinale TaxID=138064 RepID=A0ABR2XUB7_9PEZI
MAVDAVSSLRMIQSVRIINVALAEAVHHVPFPLALAFALASASASHGPFGAVDHPCPSRSLGTVREEGPYQAVAHPKRLLGAAVVLASDRDPALDPDLVLAHPASVRHPYRFQIQIVNSNHLNSVKNHSTWIS